ncbi:MAG TPA: DUF4238 domain-containing protein [Verrucomicrobiae bacterium]|nr:DUF4238 domain-containing protein [Verrucomicrobiae bacterium]
MPGFKYNHYVPEWYQKNFISPDSTDGSYFYLRLRPEGFRDSKGRLHYAKPLKKWHPSRCFAEDDLYTTRFSGLESRDIERLFFGAIDTKGKDAVDHFINYQYPDWRGEPIGDLLQYMTTQRMRTKKGLVWLSEQINSNDTNEILRRMVELKNVFDAIWTECVWQLVDAADSDTKFIVSDHPITIYNRQLGPRQPTWCKGFRDPDIRMVGSHTVFPLNLNKALILTNLSWVRNPYQSSKNLRPNPGFYRNTVFDFHRLHLNRKLSELEVKQLNFIIKSRAYMFIASGKEEWLYPERDISKSDWNIFGNGILCMPDPRSMNYGGEIFGSSGAGTKWAVDSYGRRPNDPLFSKDDLPTDLSKSPLYRFKGEFARRFGPTRRGVTLEIGELGSEQDTDTMHEYHLSLQGKKQYH